MNSVLQQGTHLFSTFFTKGDRLTGGEDDSSKTDSAKKKESLCIIDVGGGQRGIYAAGVLDALMESGIEADLCIGVSAGSANLATFIARQHGRTYRFYHDFAFRKDYASISNYFFKHTYFDFDYIYSTLSNRDGEYPLDYQALMDSKTELLCVCTNAITGRPVYFDKSRIAQDEYSILKASCSVPYLCHPNLAAGLPLADGTVSDPIPIEKALEAHSEKIVILTARTPEPIDAGILKEMILQASRLTAYSSKYPAIQAALKARSEVHNRSLALAQTLQKQGRVLILSPDDLCKVSPLYGRPDQLDALYQAGLADANKVIDFLSSK